VALDRVRRLDDGRIVLTLKTAWADGTRQLLFQPLELLEKLAVLIRGRKSIWCSITACSPHFELARARGWLWRPAGA
jgi:hypothetical protein